MDKLPVEIFVDKQMKQTHYQDIIARMAVDPAIVRMVLISYLKDQNVHFVTAPLAEALGTNLAEGLANGQFTGSLMRKVRHKK